jgi:hypothetical protein
MTWGSTLSVSKGGGAVEAKLQLERTEEVERFDESELDTSFNVTAVNFPVCLQKPVRLVPVVCIVNHLRERNDTVPQLFHRFS